MTDIKANETSTGPGGGCRAESARVKGFALLYLAIAAVFVAMGPRIFASDWVGSSDFHACVEITSSFIALIAALGCLVYYFGQGRRYFLIIGLGFLICGSEDLMHGIFGFERLFAGSGADFSRFIPGTYVAGRSVLAVMIIAAALLEPFLDRLRRLRWEAAVFSAVALAIGGGVTTLAFMLPLPQFIYPDHIIARPVDFISAVLYLAAFAITLRRFLRQRDVFTGSLLVCILLNLGGQVYMSFSKQLFDVFFDVAHWANILSYCMPVAGITVEALGGMKAAQRESADRRRAEAAQRVSEERFRQIADNAQEWVWEVDDQGAYTYASPAVTRILGYDPEELVGRKHFYDTFHPDDREELKKAAFEAFARKEPFREFINRNVRKDGTIAWLSTSGVPVIDERSHLRGYRGADKDITDRRHSEEALKAERQQFISMFDGMEEAVYVADPETHELLYLNGISKKLWGDRLGEKCYRVLQNRDAPCLFCTNDRIFGENLGQPYIWEFQNEVSQRWYRCLDRAIRWSDGRMVRFEMAIDIHERKQAEEELNQRVQEVSEAKHRLEVLVSGTTEREQRMVDLKQEVNDLLEELGRKPKYESPRTVTELHTCVGGDSG
ncbi:MAG: PAS domain S-box protein [Planctomycetota bacterium]